MRLRTIVYIFVLLVAIIVGFVTNLAREAGEFKSIVSHGNEHCKLIAKNSIIGAEDFTVDYKSGMILGCFDASRPQILSPTGGFSKERIKKSKNHGGCFAFDPKTESPEVVHLEGSLKDFHPHGIGLYQDGDEQLIFVVNHRSDGDSIDIFKIISPTHWKLLYSVAHPVAQGLNDVFPLSPTSFYTTTWHYYEDENFLSLVESYGQQKWTFVSYCEFSADKPQDVKCHKVAENIGMANGVAVSADKSTVYIAASLEKCVKIYARNANNSLTFVEDLHLNSCIDNIEVTPDGTLYIGSHPQALTFVVYTQKPESRIAPSEVFKVNPKTKNVEQVFLSLGNDLSASSSGVVVGDKLIVGGVYAPGLLVCQKK